VGWGGQIMKYNFEGVTNNGGRSIKLRRLALHFLS